MIDRRALTQRQKVALILAQNGRCAENECGCKLCPGFIEFDHIQALIHGGDNEPDNWRAICTNCHKAKTRRDVQARSHCDRIAIGGRQRKGPPMPGSRLSKFKKLMSGQVVLR